MQKHGCRRSKPYPLRHQKRRTPTCQERLCHSWQVGLYPRAKKPAPGSFFAHCGAPPCSNPHLTCRKTKKAPTLRLVLFLFWRKRWDSNPRTISLVKRFRAFISGDFFCSVKGKSGRIKPHKIAQSCGFIGEKPHGKRLCGRLSSNGVPTDFHW